MPILDQMSNFKAEDSIVDQEVAIAIYCMHDVWSYYIHQYGSSMKSRKRMTLVVLIEPWG